MKYTDLRDFIAQLEARGELKRIGVEVDPRLEITEICDRVLKAGGPALLFERPKGHAMPVLANLFGTPRRVALGMGAGRRGRRCAKSGRLLAFLKEPEPPKGLKDAGRHAADVQAGARTWRRRCVVGALPGGGAGRATTSTSARLPVQTCWPGDAGPLITWGLGDARAAARRGRTSASTGSR